jgi:hypothetical protein
MASRSLRSQLNQIRAWVRQGRTDAWIAHQLEVSASQLRDFRSQHGLSPDEDDSGQEIDLRDEIEAEIEAAAEAETDEPGGDEGGDEPGGDEPEPDGSEAEGRPRRRRRRGRRGGRRRRKPDLEATFDHGEKDGFGLWLDPAIQEDATYAEHWAGHREMTVRFEPDQIVIRRAGDPAPEESEADD